MIYRNRNHILQLEVGTRHRTDMPDRFIPHLYIGVKNVIAVALNATSGLAVYFGKGPGAIGYYLKGAKCLSFASTPKGFSFHLGPPIVKAHVNEV